MSEAMKRSHLVAEFTEADLGQERCLMGWCHKQRDLGALVFVTLRDRSGELQLLIDDEALLEKARAVRSEDVLACRGRLALRQDPNPEMPTGRYELHVTELKILSKAKTPPFYIEDGVDARESLRLEHRYLDLRRPEMQATMLCRHRIAKVTRDWFDRHGFLEIETPILVKSTPEGARDYLVPSRVFPGEFFALPQSPQIYKQLLMASGVDRYMQLARCFRDEDLRADRQPEFTQIDVEMSFMDEAEIRTLMEDYVAELFDEVAGLRFERPLTCMPYKEAMARFGSDKPDVRFGMEIKDLSDLAQNTGFKVFQDCLAQGGSVRGIALPQGASMSRRQIDHWTDLVKTYRAKGLVWIALEKPWRGSALKFLDEQFIRGSQERLEAKEGDMLLMVADQDGVALEALGHLRVALAKDFDLIDPTKHALLWVTEMPMFEQNAEEGRLVAKHHPFTMPKEEDLPLLESHPLAVRAKAYDIVMDGQEMGGGSVRIHDQALQTKIFELIGFSEAEAKERFGFLLKAFAYGVPPHGGIAFGLDRMVMLLTGTENIRDVIAFPKISTSACLMAACPSPVDPKQLDELALRVTPKEASDER